MDGAGSVVASYCTDSSGCTNQQGQEVLAAYNTEANKNQVGIQSNVSFDRVGPALLGTVISQAAAANAGGITITSANDSTHTSDQSNHYSGQAIDVSKGAHNNPQFNAYIAQTYTDVPNQIVPSLKAYRDSNGFVWTDEGNHWHVSKSGK